MKFMKLGTRPDTFYTEEATRTSISELPCNLTIRINNITYLLHKFPLLPKCGLLQRLCPDTVDSTNLTLELHDIPGGEDAFELCAKFCYGITINLSAHNFVSALCAAKFLRMTESVEKGNFVSKLEAFFNSCILEGWKDSIVTLQTTGRLPDWSENLGIIRMCIDSIVEKILTPPPKVTWSYTYTRPGYAHKKHHQSAPKDWWTEDIADLDVDLFRCIVTTVKSTNLLQPQLIGEALYVYACRWLPDITKTSKPVAEASAAQTTQESVDKKRQLETIVSIIPEDRGSVSVGFLLRLISMAIFLRVSPVIKTELIKQCSLQFEEATVNDLLLPSHASDDQHFYDIDLVDAVLESFLTRWRRQPSGEHNQTVRVIRKVGKLVDSYLQVVARDATMPVQKVVSLAKALPEIARPEHDDLYKAINIYLKEHSQLTKAEKKQLCSVLDCQRLSPEVCAHVVKNERLPLRTVVQVLFFEQERGGAAAKATASHEFGLEPELHSRQQQQAQVSGEGLRRLHFGSGEQSSKTGGTKSTTPGNTAKGHYKSKILGQRVEPETEQKLARKKVVGLESEQGREIVEGSKMDPKKIRIQRSKSEHGRNKGRERTS